MPATFETARIYSARSICDADCIFEYAIIDRTAKTVWIVPARDGQYEATAGKRACRVKVSPVDGGEMIYPLGRYSMAPTLRANKPGALAKMAPIKI